MPDLSLFTHPPGPHPFTELGPLSAPPFPFAEVPLLAALRLPSHSSLSPSLDLITRFTRPAHCTILSAFDYTAPSTRLQLTRSLSWDATRSLEGQHLGVGLGQAGMQGVGGLPLGTSLLQPSKVSRFCCELGWSREAAKGEWRLLASCGLLGQLPRSSESSWAVSECRSCRHRQQTGDSGLEQLRGGWAREGAALLLSCSFP